MMDDDFEVHPCGWFMNCEYQQYSCKFDLEFIAALGDLTRLVLKSFSSNTDDDNRLSLSQHKDDVMAQRSAFITRSKQLYTCFDKVSKKLKC